jgi:nucleoid-associated protein YgaU
MASHRSILRLGAVWLAAMAAATGLALLAAPDAIAAVTAVRSGGAVAAGFGRWVVWGAAGAASLCAAWFAVVASLVLGSALTGAAPAAVPGCPPWLRRGLLAAGGLALAGAVAAPAGAEPGHPATPPSLARLVEGLPRPDRTTGTHRPLGRAAAAPPAPHDVVVVAGDCLWRVAAASLPAHATDAEITARWHRIYRLNRAAIGADPDLIQPGQRLRLPPTTTRGAR